MAKPQGKARSAALQGWNQCIEGHAATQYTTYPCKEGVASGVARCKAKEGCMCESAGCGLYIQSPGDQVQYPGTETCFVATLPYQRRRRSRRE